jgi:hypothetical protein
MVLGARLTPQGTPGRVLKLRLAHAFNLWRQDCPGAWLLLMGGRQPGRPESEARAMAEWCLTWAEEQGGLELRRRLNGCLILEEQSHNTASSARHALEIVQRLGLTRVGLVTDALHLRRALWLFRRQFRRHGLEVVPRPAPEVLASYWRQRRYLRLGKMALREGGAWLKLLAKIIHKGH